MDSRVLPSWTCGLARWLLVSRQEAIYRPREPIGIAKQSHYHIIVAKFWLRGLNLTCIYFLSKLSQKFTSKHQIVPFSCQIHGNERVSFPMYAFQNLAMKLIAYELARKWTNMQPKITLKTEVVERPFFWKWSLQEASPICNASLYLGKISCS